MRILAIDPGKATGIAVYDSDTRTVTHMATVDASYLWPAYDGINYTTAIVMAHVEDFQYEARPVDCLAIEAVVGYGTVDLHTIATLRMEDRLSQAFGMIRITRAAICSHLGVVGKSKDAKVKLALEERFGANCFERGNLCKKRKNKSHGDDCPVCNGSGWAREPGAMAGVNGHMRAALAVAVAVHEMGLNQ